jgi:hypothetical protein
MLKTIGVRLWSDAGWKPSIPLERRRILTTSPKGYRMSISTSAETVTQGDIKVIDDIVFGVTPDSEIVWTDGYTWLGVIEEKYNLIDEGIERLKEIVRKVFREEADPSMRLMIADFDSRLTQAVAESSFVREMDGETFRIDLKTNLSKALPGLASIGDDFDTSVLLDAYGQISARYPDFEEEKGIAARIKGVFTRNHGPTAEQVYDAIARSMENHLMADTDGVIQLTGERLDNFSSMTQTMLEIVKPAYAGDAVGDSLSNTFTDLMESVDDMTIVDRPASNRTLR